MPKEFQYRGYSLESLQGMSMDEFIKRGFSWVVSGCTMHFKRPLRLGDIAVVKTKIDI